MTEKMLDFIRRSPVNVYAVKTGRDMLERAGFSEWKNGEPLKAGDTRYITRNGTSLLAFRIPEGVPAGFVLSAAHTDSPCFRLRDHAEMPGTYLKLNASVLGGPIRSTWLDRPLSIAGKVLVRTETGAESRLIDMEKDCAIMPTMAGHLFKGANEGIPLDLNKDITAIYGPGESAGSFRAEVARLAGCAEEDIISTDLYLYSNEPGTVWGPSGDYLSAPRLDDLAAAFTNLEAFLTAAPSDRIQIVVLFDNEEIGSRTKQGAGSDLLPRTLRRIASALGITDEAFEAMLDNSFMVSSDNAHAKHPNYPELSDANEAPLMNAGPAVKHSPKYATDAVSAALFKEICRRAGVPTQDYANRPDLGGGSTLGTISNEATSIWTVDIGLPQLSMHSTYETMGAKDVGYGIAAVKAVYEARFTLEGDSFRLE